MIGTFENSTEFFEVVGSGDGLPIEISAQNIEEGLWIYRLSIQAISTITLPPVQLKFNLPAIDILGTWHPYALYDKRILADWEELYLSASSTIGAPVICLFGQNDQNRITIACADTINPIQLGLPVREETNLVCGTLSFFTENPPSTDSYETYIRVDTRPIPFSQTLEEVSEWWEQDQGSIVSVPPYASEPVYSTWYSYHQSLSEEALLRECELAKEMGYKVIIIDDGWQTNDSNRGYDFTGDWQAERLTQLRSLADQIHELGMKVMTWYSVPFCGVKSKAYQQFKGKFLTENHRWAPVLDPRYPEVREYLINTYKEALVNWNLDGFKLDFIDDFRVYPDTPEGKFNGRDYASVYQASERLMGDVYRELSKIKADVLIEFRQKFIGPAMQQYANMFRAFDCPQDHVSNRIRTTDTRLLSPTARVHSDMITWNYEEQVEIAALQFLSIMFSVPQISVRLDEVPKEHIEMLSFYTQFWTSRKEVLLDGEFSPQRPLANYPLIQSNKQGHWVIGVYEPYIVPLSHPFSQLDLLNGSQEEAIYLKIEESWGSMKCEVFDCRGRIQRTETLNFTKGIMSIPVPRAGIISISELS